MSSVEFISKNLSWLPKGVSRVIEKNMQKIPAVKKLVAQEQAGITDGMEHSFKPYHDKFERHSALPATGIDRTKILADIEEMHQLESARWKDGYVSGGIYHGDQGHIDFLNRVYALQSQSNPIHSDLFPSSTKFDAEIVSMTANMLGKGKTSESANVCGTVTSGGTESILCAMKTYRDQAREERGITAPEMLLPVTAHVAFEKAALYFGIKIVHIPMADDFRADVKAAERAITRNTIVIVGSAPNFPHGIIDPIKELSDLALKHGLGFHTDCCLGGFVLPFAEKLGYPVPPFDFRLPGVTSISADTHKYGYAAKGTSVVLYRNEALRHYQYYTATEWPGGLYMSPSLTGSRPGALSAACWAAMLSMGEEGYMRATKAILETAAIIRKGVETIPELKVIGNPLWIIAFRSDSLNVYEVLDRMTKKHWNLNGLHKPACVHFALTLRQTQPGVAERFINDLCESVEEVKKNPGSTDGNAPVYGLAANLPFRGMVTDILKKTLDVFYRV